MLERLGLAGLIALAVPVSLLALLAAGCGGAPSLPAAEPTLLPATAAQILGAVRAPGARAVLVNVWATWCQPCVEEFPDLVRLHRAYEDRGLRLVLVSADFEEQQDAVLAFLRKQGVDFPTYLKDQKDEAFIDGLDARWSGALPASFVFDDRGAIVQFWEGKQSYAAFESKIAPLLK